jgi:hypothetical protein
MKAFAITAFALLSLAPAAHAEPKAHTYYSYSATCEARGRTLRLFSAVCLTGHEARVDLLEQAERLRSPCLNSLSPVREHVFESTQEPQRPNGCDPANP